MAGPDAPAIEIDGLEKRYGDVEALKGVSLSVAPGEIFGLLGHNGAGKTTTVRILTGRTRPSGGSASVLGLDVVRDRERIKPAVNLVFEEQNVYPRMTGRENLRFFAQLYGVDESRVQELLGLVGLTADAAGRRAGDYSTGMKQRLLIARALVNRPRVLFLDEPTRGLDPASARGLRALIASLAGEGTTVFLTTHDLEDADALCHRVGFLSGGRLVALDTPTELKLRAGERSVRVLLSDRREVSLKLDDPADASRLAGWMSAGEVLSVHSQEGTLADVFVSLAGESAEGEFGVSWRRIGAIARKDTLAARRDSRIFVLLLLPLALALLLRTGDSERPHLTIAVTADAPAALGAALKAQAGAEAELTVTTSASARAAEKRVQDGDAEVALVVEPGFSEALEAGRHPQVTLIEPRRPGSDSALATALIDPALREVAGQEPPAQVVSRRVAGDARSAVDTLGSARFTLLVIAVYVIANIALIVVPMLVAEEQEQGTLDALLLAGSPLDVGAAKALLGVAAIAITLFLTVTLSRITPEDTLLFAGAALLLAIVLTAFGLLLGVLLRTSAQVNTWMSVLILPVIAPAVLVGFPLPAAARFAVDLTPTAEATRLLANGLAGESVFGSPLLSALGLVLWGIAGYALLARALARREA